MEDRTDLHRTIDKLTRERDAYAEALALSNQAFMEKVKEFSIVKRLAEAINWHWEKSQVCIELVDVIIDETTAENCSLWLVEEDGEHIHLAAVKGQENDEAKFFAGEGERKRMKLGTGAAGWVAQKGESLLIEDVTKNPRFIPAGEDTIEVKSLLCLPIRGKSRVMGVLNLSHPDIGAFSQENERVLTLITDHAGIVLTNLALLEKIRAFNKRLEEMVEERTRNLQESEERYQRAIVAGKVGVWDWCVGTWDIFLDPNLKAMLGYTGAEGPADLKQFLHLTHVADRLPAMRGMMRHLRGETPAYECELRMLHREGHLMWFFVRGAAIRGNGGEVTRVSGSHTDITMRKLAEMALKKTQEEALVLAHAQGRAEFATTVLHNVGNVLNGLNVNGLEIRSAIKRMGFDQLLMAMKLIQAHKEELIQFLTEDSRGVQLPNYLMRKSEIVLRELETLEALSRDINAKVQLMGDIIETQQSHARDGEELRLEDLGKLIDEAVKVEIDRITRNGIQVEKHYGAVPPVVVPWSRLVHVLVNLIKNAVESMEDVPRERRQLTIEIGRDQEDNTLISVIDNGKGIDQEHLPRLFEHGFTTKRSGHGFGLHYCAKAVAQMGGQIKVSRSGSEGTTFTILFPPAMRNPDFRPVPKAAPAHELESTGP